jgi:hypothetical protein
MINGVVSLARAHSAALISAPVRAVTTAPPAPPVVDLPNPTGVPLLPPLPGGDDPFTVIEKPWVDGAPQLLVYVAVAEHDVVGLTLCWRDVPEVPQPLHAQLPPDDGVGAKITCAPELMEALAVWTPLMKGVIAVGLQGVGPGSVLVGPNEQYRGVPTLIAGNNEAEQAIGPVSVANTNVPDLPYATERVPLNVHVSPSLPHFV